MNKPDDETIALMEKLHREREHSAFLEELLEALHGDGWDELTLFEAKQWRKKHLSGGDD